MTPRPRKRGNRDLPPNLYATRTNYEYVHPVNKTRHGMGSDRNVAIKRAKILNAKLIPDDTVIAKVMGAKSVSDVIQRFRDEYLPEKEYAPRTAKEMEYRLNRYDKEFGSMAWSALTLSRLADWLKPMSGESHRINRWQWIEIYRFARATGLAQHNIAEMTLPKKAAKRVRKRWTLAQFEATREQAEPWLQIAMDLALITLQRREDLVNMRFDQVQDNRIFLTQGKTGKRLAIGVSNTLAEILARSRAQRQVCPYIISRKPKRDVRSGKKHPFQITPGFFSKAIAEARDKTDCFEKYGDGERPTLHEIRSLGAHLYRESGFEEKYIQALLGHENIKMTEHYLDGHKVIYDEVEADLTLPMAGK